MRDISRRLDRIEKRLRIGEKRFDVFYYVDKNGVVLKKIEMTSAEFRKMLQEIGKNSRGLPTEEEIRQGNDQRQITKCPTTSFVLLWAKDEVKAREELQKNTTKSKTQGISPNT